VAYFSSAMAILKKSLIIVALLILLAIAKVILNSLSPSSQAYHELLIFDYQILLLVWLSIFILIKLVSKKPFKFIRLTISLSILTLLFDALFHWMIGNPSTIPGFLKPTFKSYYTTYYRNIIQYDPYSQYDTAFFYALKPRADFPFGNVEFINSYSTNRLGLRDDQPSVTAPQIVCLGDSYTLGWGVDQYQTFAHLLEENTRKKVLNVSMSSYGTPRELKWLNKIDTSSLQYIIIQYCRNDVEENRVFNVNGHLPISSEESYNTQVQTYHWQRRYFPGKYSITIGYNFIKSSLRKMIKGSSSPYYLSDDPKASAVEFVKVLDAYSSILSRKKVFILDLNDFHEMNSKFLMSVDSVLNTDAYSKIRNSIINLDVSNTLLPEDFYLLDAHLKPSGHRKIANALSRYIQ